MFDAFIHLLLVLSVLGFMGVVWALGSLIALIILRRL